MKRSRFAASFRWLLFVVFPTFSLRKRKGRAKRNGFASRCPFVGFCLSSFPPFLYEKEKVGPKETFSLRFPFLCEKEKGRPKETDSLRGHPFVGFSVVVLPPFLYEKEKVGPKETSSLRGVSFGGFYDSFNLPGFPGY